MYFIAIVLPPSLNEKVMKLKLYMHQNFGCGVALKSPAHITIIPPFWMEADKETLLLSDLDQISSRFSPFCIDTAGFGCFKPKTIFIRPKPNNMLNLVKQEAEAFFAGGNYKIKAEDRAFHPHITIATRDLFKKDFAAAWPLFEKQDFNESWEVTGLSLLRHNKKNWDVVHTSQFKTI